MCLSPCISGIIFGSIFCKDGLHRMKYVNIQCILTCLYLYNLSEWNEIEMWILLETFDGSHSFRDTYKLILHVLKTREKEEVISRPSCIFGCEFSIKCLPNTTKCRWLLERSRESSRTFPLVVSDVLNKLCFHFWSPLCGLFSSQQPIYCTRVRPWRIISQA